MSDWIPDNHVAQILAPFAIGMSVFIIHLVLIPVDGCSINPARSFGPAMVARVFHRYWIFWVCNDYSSPLCCQPIAVRVVVQKIHAVIAHTVVDNFVLSRTRTFKMQ